MSFLVIAREPYALPIGESTIGGSGDDALPVPGVSATSPLAELQAMPDGSATIRRLGGDVRVNGTAIGAEPVALRHGMRLEVGGVGMLYGDMAARGSTAHVAGVSDDDLALLADLSPVEPTAPTGGRLVAAESGTTHDIPDGGIEIGRDPACGLALTSKDVSRLHADIRPGLRGYVLTDRSVNGTFVNGARVADPRVLGNGDVIRVGREEFRFFADAATYAEPSAGTPVARDGGTPRVSVPPGTVMPGSTGSTLFATLEIVNTGPLQGTRFRIERPCSVEWRPFQPGGEVLPGTTPAEQDEAFAAHLRGAASPITVVLDGGELEVGIDSDMEITLTGTADPVYSGRLSAELLARLGSL